MIRLYVDNDACPVREEILTVADRMNLPVTLVSNQGMRPLPYPNVTQIFVGSGPDQADHWIVENVMKDDIVVTADIVLAKRCLEKLAIVLNAKGYIFTDQNIGHALSMRSLQAHLRETGESKGFNPSFSSKDRSHFLQALDKIIQKLRRNSSTVRMT